MFRRFGSRRRPLLAAGVVCVLGVVGVGYAFGAIPGAGGVIQGCYDSGGNLKVVNALPCPKNSTSLSWNQTGPTGPARRDRAGATGARRSRAVELSCASGSPCTVNARASLLEVSVDSATGVVSMVCTPMYRGQSDGRGWDDGPLRIREYPLRVDTISSTSTHQRRTCSERNVCSSRSRGRFPLLGRWPPLHVHLPERSVVTATTSLVPTAAPTTRGQLLHRPSKRRLRGYRDLYRLAEPSARKGGRLARRPQPRSLSADGRDVRVGSVAVGGGSSLLSFGVFVGEDRAAGDLSVLIFGSAAANGSVALPRCSKDVRSPLTPGRLRSSGSIFRRCGPFVNLSDFIALDNRGQR